MQLTKFLKALSRDTPLAYPVPLQVARWQVAGWPGGQVTGGTN